MNKDLAGKKIAVLSDHDVLSSAIELGLNSCLEIETMQLVEGSTDSQIGDLDLVVVAMSSPDHEPVVALARSALAGRIGQVPLLISSYGSCQSAPDVNIFCLNFPFELDELCDLVRNILQGEYRAAEDEPGAPCERGAWLRITVGSSAN
jgi:hypothetical protein